jgi:hypothetical protein
MAQPLMFYDDDDDDDDDDSNSHLHRGGSLKLRK